MERNPLNVDIKTNSLILVENYCEICDHQSLRAGDYKKHIQSMRHRRKTGEETQKGRNNRQHVCEVCDYVTDRKCNYTKHIQSEKHFDTINSNQASKSVCQHCNKLYTGTNNLRKHMKVCKEIKREVEDQDQDQDQYDQIDIQQRDQEEDTQEEDDEDEMPQTGYSSNTSGKLNMREMFFEFMKVIQNSDEVKNLLIKQNEELKQHLANTNTNANNTNSNNTNSHNTQFNLQVFLNEQCKDALDIMDFVDSLDINVSDLEETGKLGFIDGITRIFANGLNKLDLYKRPIHCTDLKREMLYIKDKNKWEKEVDGKPIFKKAVNRVSNMNLRQLKKWQELNPGYDIVDTEKNDEFIHLSTQAIGSCSSQETDRNLNKIMKNLYKQVVLDKKDGSLYR